MPFHSVSKSAPAKAKGPVKGPTVKGPGGRPLGKAERRSNRQNASCIDTFLSHLTSHADILSLQELPHCMVLGRVVDGPGGARVRVLLQDGDITDAPIAGSVAFRGRASTKTDRDSCMMTDDFVIVCGGQARAKVHVALASLILQRFRDHGVSVPAGWLSGAPANASAAAAGDAFEFDRTDQAREMAAALAAVRADYGLGGTDDFPVIDIDSI